MMKASVALAGKAQEMDDHRRGRPLPERLEHFCLMKGKKDEGPQDEEGDSLFQIPFDPSQGFYHHVRELGDS